MEPVNLGTAGVCIYCGARDGLQKEHVVPYSIGGVWVYYKASCAECATITGRVEGGVMQGFMGGFRAKLETPTRRPDQRPTMHPLGLRFPDGSTRIVQVPTADYPGFLTLLELRPPGCLVPGRRDEQAVVCGRASMVLDPDVMEPTARKHGAIGIDHKAPMIPSEFMRMLGKAAYSFAAATLGPATFLETPIVDSILGRDERIARWVGGPDVQPPMPEEPMFHRLQVGVMDGTVWVTVRLLEIFGGPQYIVNAGQVPIGTHVPASTTHIGRAIIPRQWVARTDRPKGFTVTFSP